jgi:hypothetical protein
MNNVNYNKYNDEIRKIRDRQYEETKDMTDEELMEYTNKKADRVHEEIEKIRAEKRTKTA